MPVINHCCTRTPDSYNEMLHTNALRPFTGQPALAGTHSEVLEDFDGAKFYCLHALADGH